MGKIQKMSMALANMIAAGEVVERPSSVVKELVENSIDANASSITIYLKNGGLDYIDVIDDGDGMDEDDVLMAFIPHATSKIKNEYDLFRIMTLGFRGEAIASIASVSTMKITSSQDGIKGYSCTYKAGSKQESGVTHSNKGTSVEVLGLFFNTPARLKYMKTAKSELASIMFYIDRISMSKPDLRFTVYHDDKLIFQTTGSKSYQTLIGEVYGVEAAKNVIEYGYVEDGYKATLVLVKPSIYRSNKLEITMICNGRYVKNYNITNAVIDGFQTYLPIGKYPIVVLYFTIDPLLVDVNVHPTKTEIKISNEEAICNRLKEKIREALTSTTHIPEREIEKNKKTGYLKQTIFDNIYNVSEENSSYISSANIGIKDTDTINKPIAKENKLDIDRNITPTYNNNSTIVKNNNESKVLNEYSNNNSKSIEPIKEEIKRPIETHFPHMEYVGTIFGTYLIFQGINGVYLVDQHAAAERYNYEKFYKLLGDENQPTTELLIPISVHFTKEEGLYVEENLDKFSQIGFRLESLGNNDFVVREIPLWAKLDDVSDIVYEILNLLIENRRIDVIYFRDHIAKQISCKASIKANHQLSRVEIDTLMKNLDTCTNPFTCPHGRPTIIELSLHDLEKMFERIQSK